MQQELEDQRTQCVNAGQEAQAVIEARADKALETLEKDGKVALEIAESGVEAAQKAMDETTAGDDGEGGALRVELTKALAANTTLRGKMGTVLEQSRFHFDEARRAAAEGAQAIYHHIPCHAPASLCRTLHSIPALHQFRTKHIHCIARHSNQHPHPASTCTFVLCLLVGTCHICTIPQKRVDALELTVAQMTVDTMKAEESLAAANDLHSAEMTKAGIESNERIEAKGSTHAREVDRLKERLAESIEKTDALGKAEEEALRNAEDVTSKLYRALSERVQGCHWVDTRSDLMQNILTDDSTPASEGDDAATSVAAEAKDGAVDDDAAATEEHDASNLASLTSRVEVARAQMERGVERLISTVQGYQRLKSQMDTQMTMFQQVVNTSTEKQSTRSIEESEELFQRIFKAESRATDAEKALKGAQEVSLQEATKRW